MGAPNVVCMCKRFLAKTLCTVGTAQLISHACAMFFAPSKRRHGRPCLQCFEERAGSEPAAKIVLARHRGRKTHVVSIAHYLSQRGDHW
jgi:hypothetical protein